MSINITVHGNKLEKSTRKSVLADPEHVKKERLVERRKQRLEQVRQQSKDVAQKIRKNVNEEIKKQERQIEDQKHKELLEWREKALAEARVQRNKSLNAVGNAHRAAINERDAEASRERVKTQQTIIAHKRGRDALQKEKENLDTKKLANRTACHKSARQGKTIHSKPAEKHTAELKPSAEEVDAESSGFSTELEEEEVSKPSIPMKQNKPVRMDINTDSDESSSVSLVDSHEESNRHYVRTKEKHQEAKHSKASYNAYDYHQNETSSSDKSNSIETTKPKQFTKISEFIQKRQSKTEVSATTSDIPAPVQNSIANVKSCLKGNTQQESVISSKLPSESAKKTSIISKPRSEISNSVQFYDYDNKYSKQYEAEQAFVRQIVKSKEDMTAMQNAHVEQQLQQNLTKTRLEAQKKAMERHRKALEIEKIRRDCALFEQQLKALNQEQDVLREVETVGPIDPMMRIKLERAAEAKKKSLEAAFEEVFKKPKISACHKTMKNVPTTSQKGKRGPISSNIEDTKKKNEIKNFEFSRDDVTTDSCVTTLLNRAQKQSDQISRDIEHCGNSNTLKQLKCLLEKINHLRDQILLEISNCNVRNEKNIRTLDDIARQFDELRSERENILGEEKENIECIKKDLYAREKLLKEKEENLQKKLKKIAAIQMTSGMPKDSTESVMSGDLQNKKLENEPVKVPSSVPIEIVIKVKNETVGKHEKSPYKSPRKVSSLIQDFKHAKRKKATLGKHKSSKLKEDSESAKVVTTVEVSPARSKSSTSYCSLPEVIHTKLGELLSVPRGENSTATKEDGKKTIAINKSNQMVQSDTQLNPTLLHYIQRLLGMSRSSIDMLGVSSSEIVTPSSSLVADPANASTSTSLNIQSERLQRLREFINDNYSLISELEESFKSGKSSTSNSSSNRLTESIWQSKLQQSEKQNTALKLENEIKSILKKKTSKKLNTKIQTAPANKRSVETQVSEISTSDKLVGMQIPIGNEQPEGPKPTSESNVMDQQHQLVDKYAELTLNCTKRIAELTNMINQVRKEKQRIVETTLSSSNGTDRLSTEYCELPDGFAAKSDDDSSKILELKGGLEVQIESDRAQLEKNKLTGVSRDSGISLSRPVTALDTVETNVSVVERFFSDYRSESHLKEAQKLSPQRHEETSSTLKKPLKPPASIARYSPQLVEDRAHELSTILEVETPATSRLNASVASKKLPVVEINISGSLKREYEFPTYEEYISKHNLNVSQYIDVEMSSKSAVDIETIEEALSKGNLQYEEFPSMNTYLRDQGQINNTQHSTSVQAMSVKPNIQHYQHFPSHKSYVEKHGDSGLLDSQSIAAVSFSDCSIKPEDSESTESLPDVVAELKRRNILKHSFKNQDVASNQKALSDETSSTNGDKETNTATSSEITPTTKHKFKITTLVKSPFKLKVPVMRHVKSNRTLKEKAGRDVDLTGIDTLPSTGTDSKDTSESIGRELNEMGLKWASLMLKKSQQSMELGSTSSSFTYEHKKSPKKSPKKTKIVSATFPEPLIASNIDNSSHTSIHPSNRSSHEKSNKAFNLKEFFTRELQKRATTSVSASSTDDSLASQFIKSLLGSANSTPTPTSGARTAQERQRHHTSTPVQQTKSSPSSKSSQDASKLFSAESRISSVRMSTESQSSTVHFPDRDTLNVSHMKLKTTARTTLSELRSNEHAS